MQEIKLYSENFQELIGEGVHFLQQDANVKEVSENSQWQRETASLSCSCCKFTFPDGLQHREHYKLDWHRYNLKQMLASRPTLNEQEFNAKADDVSSISGSDSDSDNDVENVSKICGKIFLKNAAEKVFCIYRCLVLNKKDEIDNETLVDRVRKLGTKWCVLMLGGGHFAGGVFHGGSAILHKTFHCYTHVSSILEAWKDEIAECSVIMYRAPGPYNLAVLFGGKNSPFNRADPRLKSIPFSTRRPTFAELRRVHDILTTIKVYQNLESALEQEFRKKTRVKVATKAIPEKIVEEIVPSSDVIKLESSESDASGDVELLHEDRLIDFSGSLQPFDDSLTDEQRKKGRKKPKKSKNQRAREREAARKQSLIQLIQQGCVEDLKGLLDGLDEAKKLEQINEVLDECGNSLLHLAAMHERVDLIVLLLDHNANVCLTNDRHQTPYTVTDNKNVRSVFKQFAADNPDKYNYNKANIPTNTLTEEEKAERKKMQKKVKREKEKEKKKENAVKKVEAEEQKRFLNLSDREKRALAAERRILNQSGVVLARCFLCGMDMSGRVPFEYSNNRFCSVECLKAHRLQNTKL